MSNRRNLSMDNWRNKSLLLLWEIILKYQSWTIIPALSQLGNIAVIKLGPILCTNYDPVWPFQISKCRHLQKLIDGRSFSNKHWINLTQSSLVAQGVADMKTNDNLIFLIGLKRSFLRETDFFHGIKAECYTLGPWICLILCLCKFWEKMSTNLK